MKRKRYEEFLAKNILLKCYRLKYKNLNVADKPDLQSETYGIEVCILINPNDMKSRKTNIDIKNKLYLKEFLYNNISNGYCENATYQELEKAIKIKVKKSQNYSKQTYLELFIFNCCYPIYNHNKKELLNYFTTLFKKIDKKRMYSTFFYYELGRLLIVDLVNYKISQIIIGSIELMQLITETNMEINQ